MPDKKTMQRARKDKREGKSPSTQAGEFVREEIHHVREGKHGARSPQQAIAIGLSKARRAGVNLPPPKKGTVSEKTRKSAARAYRMGHGAPPKRKPSARRSRAILLALEHEGSHAASGAALSRQAKAAARRRTAAERSAAAKKAVRTKGHAGLARAARKAAHTRAARA
ncbi:MAG: transcription elongation factor [Planctomycetia bacterium]|nr:transcription elongation factor [Planctomycetia bacterium]